MTPISAEDIRQFIIARYTIAPRITAEDIPDDFDLLLEGIIDSFGMLELIGAIEDHFKIEVDLEALDPDQLTRIGPLSRYLADQVRARDVS
jgi:acyl carrier protein